MTDTVEKRLFEVSPIVPARRGFRDWLLWRNDNSSSVFNGNQILFVHCIIRRKRDFFDGIGHVLSKIGAFLNPHGGPEKGALDGP